MLEGIIFIPFCLANQGSQLRMQLEMYSIGLTNDILSERLLDLWKLGLLGEFQKEFYGN